MQVGGVYHHGHRETEDEGGGGRGRPGSAQHRRRRGPQQGAGGGGGGAGSGEHLGLELQQLAHEAEVGGDDAASPPDELEGLVQPHPLPLHQVGQADGGRARDPRLAVDQDSPAGVTHRVWGGGGGKRLMTIDTPAVFDELTIILIVD